jgi:hypothetical protein
LFWFIKFVPSSSAIINTIVIIIMRVALALSFAGATALIVGWVAGNSNSKKASSVRSVNQEAETAKPQYVLSTRFVSRFVFVLPHLPFDFTAKE